MVNAVATWYKYMRRASMMGLQHTIFSRVSLDSNSVSACFVGVFDECGMAAVVPSAITPAIALERRMRDENGDDKKMLNCNSTVTMRRDAIYAFGAI